MWKSSGNKRGAIGCGHPTQIGCQFPIAAAFQTRAREPGDGESLTEFRVRELGSSERLTKVKGRIRAWAEQVRADKFD